jgi:hypothetical protein
MPSSPSSPERPRSPSLLDTPRLCLQVLAFSRRSLSVLHPHRFPSYPFILPTMQAAASSALRTRFHFSNRQLPHASSQCITRTETTHMRPVQDRKRCPHPIQSRHHTFRDIKKDFLSEFEDHAYACRLTDLERVDIIIHYVDPSFREYCRTLSGYRSCDWTRFQHSRVTKLTDIGKTCATSSKTRPEIEWIARKTYYSTTRRSHTTATSLSTLAT